MPSIQQTAALALGRLANYNEALAEAVVANDVLPQLVQSLSDQNVSSNLIHFTKYKCLKLLYNLQRFYKKAAAFVLRAVAKHTPALSQAVVDSNALPALVACLEDFDPSVKEAAAWAIGYIAQHTSGLHLLQILEYQILTYFKIRSCAESC